MGQRAPSVAQIAVAVAFAFSCFGLLLFLWSAFGGPVPFAPEGYRVKVPFNEATQLAVESDVRIANVSVGRVKKIELENEGENRDLAVAEIEIDDRYAPIPEDTLAMLRQKTLLGETYVELTQGSKDAPKLAEDGTLSAAQVAESVQLDEIFRTFDERTKAAFQTWMQQAAIATAGRGSDLSAAIANLEPFAEDANRLLRVLDTHDEAVSQFVKNTGVVFGALSERQGQLRGLIQNSGTVFATTARRNRDIEETFIALPTFLDESRETLNRLETFSRSANPVITQLRPAARELSTTLKTTAKIAPDLKGFFVGVRKLAKRSKTGLPALRTILSTDLPPVLTQFNPFLRQVTPIITALERYSPEVTSFLGNITAASNARARTAESNQNEIHYLRSSAMLAPEALAFYPNRLTTNRGNPYTEPGGGLDVTSALQRFNNQLCGAGVVANLDLNSPNVAEFQARSSRSATPPATELFDRIRDYAFNGANSSAGSSAPACSPQGVQSSIGTPSPATFYPHVNPGLP